MFLLVSNKVYLNRSNHTGISGLQFLNAYVGGWTEGYNLQLRRWWQDQGSSLLYEEYHMGPSLRQAPRPADPGDWDEALSRPVIYSPWDQAQPVPKFSSCSPNGDVSEVHL